MTFLNFSKAWYKAVKDKDSNGIQMLYLKALYG